MLNAKKKRGWPRGIYEIAPGFRTNIVVIAELPEVQSTLLVRLMGRGQTFKKAVKQLKRLPHDAYERRLAIPILTKYHLMTRDKPNPTPDEREYCMSTEDILHVWERKWEAQGIQKGMQKGMQKGLQKGLQTGMQKGVQKGLQEGLQEGLQKGLQKGIQGTLITLYRIRFQRIPRTLREAIQGTQNATTLNQWLPIIGTGTREQIAQAILNGARR